MVDMFIERKHGREADHVPAPRAWSRSCEETYGVIVYQEQVMRIANVLAGFALSEADNLRKAMGKKKPEIMAKFQEKFVDGCEAHGPAAREGARRSGTRSSTSPATASTRATPSPTR